MLGDDFPPFMKGLLDKHIQDGTILRHSATHCGFTV